jgi:hypothetical protein
MISKTDIANSALAYLSATSIQSFDDDEDEKARAIKSVFNTVAMEVAREHRWSCLIRRAELVKMSSAPLQYGQFGYRAQFQLPADCLRFLDLNGEPYKAKCEFMDLNGRRLLANCEVACIRYVAWVEDTMEWDVKFCETVALKLAMRIARRITKDGISSEDLYGIYQRTLKSARAIDAMEIGSGENSPLERMLERSPLINSGRQAAASRGQILGWNINLQEPR